MYVKKKVRSISFEYAFIILLTCRVVVKAL